MELLSIDFQTRISINGIAKPHICRKVQLPIPQSCNFKVIHPHLNLPKSFENAPQLAAGLFTNNLHIIIRFLRLLSYPHFKIPRLSSPQSLKRKDLYKLSSDIQKLGRLLYAFLHIDRLDICCYFINIYY